MNKVRLIDVMNEHFTKVEFDNMLAKKIYKYQVGYVNSQREYIEFYGSNLLGVHVIRFKDSDVSKFFDVLDVDLYKLSEDLKHVTDINQEFKISSDPLNLTIMYLLHRFITSKAIGQRDLGRALYDVAVLFFYRTIAALVSNNFKYPADPKIAEKAYANLNNKYLIKRLGTWGKVVDYRANKLIDPKGLHFDALKTFDDDLKIVYAINDSQGRIKDLMKNYYHEFARVHSQGQSIGSTSSLYLDAEGQETVKDKTHSVEKYVNTIRDLVTDEHGLIKDELVTIISRVNSNVSFKSLKSVLKYLHQAYGQQSTHTLIDEFIGISIIYSFHLIESSIAPNSLREYPLILTQLKNLLASSRSTDPELMKIRDLGEKIIKQSFPYSISNSLMIATRSSVVLYLVLRVLIHNK